MPKNAHNIKEKKFFSVPWLWLAFIVFLLSAAIVFSAIPKTFAANITIEAYQQQGNKAFGKETQLDIFEEFLSNSSELEKLVHPLIEGSYVFAVYNNSSSALLPYYLTFISTNSKNIPLVFSVQKNGVYILGGLGVANMVPITAVGFEKFYLAGHMTDLYTISWAWKTESDAKDTEIGNIGTQKYQLLIRVEGSIPEKELPQTGDNSNIKEWAIVTAVSFTLLFILVKRRKDEGEDNQAVSKNK